MTSIEGLYARVPAWAQTILLNAYAAGIHRHRYGASYRRKIEALRDREQWTTDRMRAFQDERVRAIVRLAYDRTSHYREVMDSAGLVPDDITGVSDLPKLPVLTKTFVRDSGARLRTRDRPARGWLKGHTSGTTGSPLDVWYDRELCVLNNAVDWRQKSWGGMVHTDWVGLLLGRVVVPTDHKRPPFWRRNRVLRQVWYSSFHLTGDNLDLYVRHMRQSGLRFLEGYPSTMFILARHVLSSGSTLPMKAVFTSSETLHAVQKETIEEAFECPVFDFYGAAERVVFATECEHHGGKHLADSYGFAEIVDEAGDPVPDGQPGRLIGTSLQNVAMPMLRYDTGDIASLSTEPCACGRSLRRMSDVSTKAEDLVVTPNGRIVSPSVLTHPFKPFHQIEKSQILQPDLSTLIVKIVPGDEFTEEHERLLQDGLRSRLGPGMTIRIQHVDDIPREASGKYRWVISSVAHDFAVPWEEEVT